MNKEITNLARLVDLENYPNNILEEVCECLKKIFDASDAYFHNIAIKGNRQGLYLPVMVDGKNIGYYEIVNNRKKVSIEEINVIVSLLLQLYTKLKYHNNIHFDNQTSLDFIHNINYLATYQNKLDVKSLIKLNCLFIKVYEYDEIVNLYGVNQAFEMIKIVVNALLNNFNLSNDTIIRYTNNQFIIFITNQTDVMIKNRVYALVDELRDIDINIAFGLSSLRSKFDLGDLIKWAEYNMYFKENGYTKYK